MKVRRHAMSYVTRHKLKRILGWFRNTNDIVGIEYYYTNSLCHEDRRKYTGTIEEFTVTTDDYWSGKEYTLLIKLSSGEIIEETIPGDANIARRDNGSFYIDWCNSGPYCHFYIGFKTPKAKINNKIGVDADGRI